MNFYRDEEGQKEYNMGLWSVRIDGKTSVNEMYADDAVLHTMGADSAMSAEEFYWFWYKRVRPDCREFVNNSIMRCISGENTLQMQYIWQHPQKGDVEVFCAASCVEEDEDTICLKGYYRMEDNG